MDCYSVFLGEGNLPNPGIDPGSPALQAASLPSEPPGRPMYVIASLDFYKIHYGIFI